MRGFIAALVLVGSLGLAFYVGRSSVTIPVPAPPLKTSECGTAVECWSQSLARLQEASDTVKQSRIDLTALLKRADELADTNKKLAQQADDITASNRALSDKIIDLATGLQKTEVLADKTRRDGTAAVIDVELDKAHLNNPEFMIKWGECPSGYFVQGVAARHNLIIPKEAGVALTGIQVKCARLAVPAP